MLALCHLKDARVAGWLGQRLREAVATRGQLGYLGEVVGCVGPWAPACLEPLIELIPLSQAGNERIAVIEAVSAYGTAATPAIPAIRAQLDAQPHIATRVLGDFGPSASSALEPLRRMVGHSIERVSANSARAVFLISKDAAPALGLIAAAFEQPSRVSSSMLELVSSLGPAAARVAPKLLPLFEAEDDWGSVRAAAAFWAVKGDSIPVVPMPRGLVAVQCLSEMGPRAVEAAPRLREFIDSPHRQVRSGPTSTLIADDEKWVAVCRDALTRVSVTA